MICLSECYDENIYLDGFVDNRFARTTLAIVGWWGWRDNREGLSVTWKKKIIKI